MKSARLISIVFAALSVAAVAAAQRPTVRPSPKSGESRSVALRLTYTLTPEEATSGITLTVAIPRSIPSRQNVASIKYSYRPARTFEEGGTSYVEFKFDRLTVPRKITIDVQAQSLRYDLSTAAANKKKPEAASAKELRPYVTSEQYLESDDAAIRRMARRAGGANRVDVTRNIMSLVAQTMTKTPFSDAERGAAWAMKNRQGDCTEYAELFVALCRARNIPARYCEGYLTKQPRNDTAKHNWAEVYLDDLGWVPFDPLHVDLRTARFEKLPPDYLLIATERNNKALDGHHYFAYRWADGKLSVSEDFQIQDLSRPARRLK